MGLEKISENEVVTGADGGRAAANLNYILYIVGFFIPITPLIAVALAYSNRETASETMRSHFDWQIKIFWRSVKFLVAQLLLYFVLTIVGVLTLGIGFILYVIPFGIWIWWLVSTIKRIARGMKALGLGQPVVFSGGSTRGGVTSVQPAAAAALASPAAVASTPPEGWYDDPDRAGRKRWWDGAAWGMRDDEHPSMVSGSPSTDAEIAVVPAEVAAAVETAVAGSPAETERETFVTAATVEASSEAVPDAAISSAAEPASEPPSARFCENCGAERRPGGRFCTSCGTA